MLVSPGSRGPWRQTALLSALERVVHGIGLIARTVVVSSDHPSMAAESGGGVGRDTSEIVTCCTIVENVNGC